MKNFNMKDDSNFVIGGITDGILCITNSVNYRGTYPIITATDEYGDAVTGYIFGNDECYDHFQNGEEYFFQYMFDPENSKYYKCCYNIPDGAIEDIVWENPRSILEDKKPWYYMEETK